MTEHTNPPLPAPLFLDWPRIPVDTADDTPYARINRIADCAARNWVMGPDGPYHREMPLAHIVSNAVGEALLHLLELGLIDVDDERITTAPGIPRTRQDCRPATDTPPQHIGNGANAETCPACAGTNLPYPFTCPGPGGNPNTEEPTNA